MKGSGIVKTFMKHYKIGAEDLFRSRFAEHKAIRYECIKRLRASGVGVMATARVMQCDEATVRYWSDKQFRESEIGRHVALYPRARKYRKLAEALEQLYA